MSKYDLTVVDYIRDHGTKFWILLAEAYLAGDSEQRWRIRSTWSEEWSEFERKAQKKDQAT